MASIVRYNLIAQVKVASGTHHYGSWKVEYFDTVKLREYLIDRGIAVSSNTPRCADRHLTITYASPAHRTRTELIMSGCPRTCELRIREITQ